MSGMRWKMIYLARRNPALRAEQFAQAWREHSALGARCGNVRDKVLSVTQCARLLDEPPLPGAAIDYDGVNLLVLRDASSASDIWNDPETLAVMRPDEPRVFSTYVRDFTLVCRERVVREAPRGEVCLIGFLRGAPPPGSLGDGAFATARRVVHNAVAQPPPPGYEYDAICEWWFESAGEARRAFGACDLRERLPLPLARAIDAPRSVFMFTHVTHSRP